MRCGLPQKPPWLIRIRLIPSLPLAQQRWLTMAESFLVAT
jgi:hypothetical protein